MNFPGRGLTKAQNHCHKWTCIRVSVCDMIMLSLFDSEDGSDSPPKHRLTSFELNDIISQKTELFTLRKRLNRTELKALSDGIYRGPYADC